jgi:hypothetical protein
MDSTLREVCSRDILARLRSQDRAGRGPHSRSKENSTNPVPHVRFASPQAHIGCANEFTLRAHSLRALCS